MKKINLFITVLFCLLLLLVSCKAPSAGKATGISVGGLTLDVPDLLLSENADIGTDVDGNQICVLSGSIAEGKVPRLTISNPPSETQSFTLVMEDVDSAAVNPDTGSPLVHWKISNIPSSVRTIMQGGTGVEFFDENDVLVDSSSDSSSLLIENEYFGPCPFNDVSLENHEYRFTVTAMTLSADGNGEYPLDYVQASSWYPANPTAEASGGTVENQIVDTDGDTLFFALDASCALTDISFKEWAGLNDGILVLDRNKDGQIQRQDMFGPKSFTRRDVANAFEDLMLLDEEPNGIINAQDSEFTHLRIWKNSGALLTLADAGVVEIHLAYRDTGEEIVKQLGTFKSLKAVEIEARLAELEALLSSLSADDPLYEEYTSEILSLKLKLEIENNRLMGGAALRLGKGESTEWTFTGSALILDLDGDGTSTRDNLVAGEICLSGGVCGDGVVDETEQCDDVNINENDECLSSCVWRTIDGEGFIRELVAQLDSQSDENVNRVEVKKLFRTFLRGLS